MSRQFGWWTMVLIERNVVFISCSARLRCVLIKCDRVIIFSEQMKCHFMHSCRLFATMSKTFRLIHSALNVCDLLKWCFICFAPPCILSAFLFVFMFVCFLSTAYVLYYCNTVGWSWWDWSLILRTLSSFGALMLLFVSFDPKKTRPHTTYNAFGGTLNLT